jgi:hypothetical protein
VKYAIGQVVLVLRDDFVQTQYSLSLETFVMRHRILHLMGACRTSSGNPYPAARGKISKAKC